MSYYGWSGNIYIVFFIQLLKLNTGWDRPFYYWLKSSNGHDVTKRAIIDVNSISGRNYDILTSIIAQFDVTAIP